MNAPTFGRDDLTALSDAHALLDQWRTFLLARFAAYTRHTEVSPMGGGAALDPIEDPFARTNAGYGRFDLGENWVLNLLAADAAHAAVTVKHVLSDDRGGGAIVRKYRLPLDFVFGEVERESKYEQYLRLKAEFEPGTGTDTPATSDPADPDGRYTAATELVAMLPEEGRPPALALLDDTDETFDRTYAAALARAAAADPGERDGMFSRIQSLAATLRLSHRTGTTRQRIEAARVLAVQSRRAHESAPTAEQIEALARPENRDKALLAYDIAMTSLRRPEHGGLGSLRRDVYAAAEALGLDTSSQAIAAARATQSE